MIDEQKISIETANIAYADLIVCTEPFDQSKDQLTDYENTLRVGIDKELTLLCANPDLVVDVGDTREMCAGSLASMYEKIGGKVIYFGKPHNNIYKEAPEKLITELKTKLKSLQTEYNDDFSIEEMKVMTDTVIRRAYNEPNKLKNKKS